MKIDEDKLENKIILINKNLDKLKELKKLSRKDFLADYRNYDSAKYNLQTSIEALIDIGNHIISRKNWGVPETNADTFRILAEKDVISKNKLSDFVAMSRFRNMVVHLYQEIDEEEIYRIIENNLEDFTYYIKRIYKLFLEDY